MRRGAPETLVLEALPVRKTKLCATGAGPLRLRDWIPIGKKYLSNRRVILHTDSAKAYLHPFPLVHHTCVVHQKKGLERHGLSRDTLGLRLCICFLERRSMYSLERIDGLWKRLRASIGKAHSSDFPRVDLLVRYMLWRTWTTGMDPWEAFPLTSQT